MINTEQIFLYIVLAGIGIIYIALIVIGVINIMADIAFSSKMNELKKHYHQKTREILDKSGEELK